MAGSIQRASRVGRLALVVIAAGACGACRPRGAAAPEGVREPAASGPGQVKPARAPASRVTPPVAPPAETLNPGQARKYMLDLINRDRATAGLAPVTLDEGPAARAGQAHAEDMASRGYLGHWGADGSVPEQRYTDAGGADMSQENASCYIDGRKRALDRAPRIEAKYVEQAERLFFDEKPPSDGHRRNILTARHSRVGIGVAQPVPGPGEVPVPCFAQEFIDAYGTYAPVPRQARVGSTLHVEGTIAAPAIFAGVGLARIDAPKPLDVAELNRRRSYQVPPPYQMYWPAGYKTPIEVKTAGPRFTVDVPMSDGGKPGTYEVSVWATVPGSRELVMVSLRTIRGQ